MFCSCCMIFIPESEIIPLDISIGDHEVEFYSDNGVKLAATAVCLDAKNSGDIAIITWPENRPER